jgi:hypothetical protein
MEQCESECVLLEMTVCHSHNKKCGTCDTAHVSKIRTPSRTASARKVFSQDPTVTPLRGFNSPPCQSIVDASIKEDVGSVPSWREIDRVRSHTEAAATAGGVNAGSPCPHQVVFFLGEERQLVASSACQLAAISPVFHAMFSGRWKSTTIELPDVQINTFSFILG